MHIPHIILMGTMTLLMATPSLAQTPPQADTLQRPKRKIIRKVEPIPYWVDADQLSIRDNPVAGNVVGMLELGNKVKAYETFENWVRISQDTRKPRWLNTKYLTNTPVTWTNYNSKSKRKRFSRANAATSDVTLKKIKVKDGSQTRLYAASLRNIGPGQKLIVTKQNFRSGPYFMKHRIDCAEDLTPNQIEFLGEGFNYVMMERQARLRADRLKTVSTDTSLPRQATAPNTASPVSVAIGDFACTYNGKSF